MNIWIQSESVNKWLNREEKPAFDPICWLLSLGSCICMLVLGIRYLLSSHIHAMAVTYST